MCEHAEQRARADVTFFQFASSFMCSPRPFLGGGRAPRSVSTRWNSSRAAVSFTVAVLGRTLRASCRQGTGQLRYPLARRAPCGQRGPGPAQTAELQGSIGL